MTLRRGWCLCELGVTTARPIMHVSDKRFQIDEAARQAIATSVCEGLAEGASSKAQRLHKLGTILRFANSNFTVESDRSLVRSMILKIFTSIEKFESHLLANLVTCSKLLMQTVDDGVERATA